jgi:hypothetical protein
MSAGSYTFLPWLREGLSAGVTSDQAPGAPTRARLQLSLSLNDTPIDLGGAPGNIGAMHLLGPGDVVGLEPGQVVRTDPAQGSTGVDPADLPSIDFDSPSLPWLFTPEAEANNRVRPWLCLIVVRQQPGVSLVHDARRNATVLEIAPPADCRRELPDLATSWAWAHAQVSGNVTRAEIPQVIKDSPERVVSRLLCPTPLKPNERYHACVVPTFAAGRTTGLGEVTVAGLDPAWRPTDTRVVLPVYYAWEFRTGEHGDFRSLVFALKGRSVTELGVGRRALDLAQCGLSVRSGDTTLIQIDGALRPFRAAALPPQPTWIRDALALQVGRVSATPERTPPLYGGEQADRSSVAATETGWLADLNLDPRNRGIAALGAFVVQDRQESLVAAAWSQVGDVTAVSKLMDSARLADAVGQSLRGRRAQPLAAPALATLSAPIQRAATEDVTMTTAYRRLTRPRGLVARRARPEASAPPDQSMKDALLAKLDPSRPVAARVQDRVMAPPDLEPPATRVPATPLAVAPSIPAPMFPELSRLAPQFVLPRAELIPPESIVLLESNRRFVAAFLAGMNTEMARELRWRGFPVDGRATFFQQFWDRRGYGGGVPTPDIQPMSGWSPGSSLEAAASGATASSQLVVAVRGELLRRYPRTLVYARKAQSDTELADDVPDNVSYPIFGGLLEPDIRFFGFGMPPEDAVGNPGWFLVFEQQPTETSFGVGTAGLPALGTGVTAADVAAQTLRTPFRVAIHAAAVLVITSSED